MLKTLALLFALTAGAEAQQLGPYHVLGNPTATQRTPTDTAITAAMISGVAREKLSAARTYFVRTDGNDSNTCLIDSAGGACLTYQGAVDKARALDFGGQTVTVRCGAEVGVKTFNGAINVRTLTGGGVLAIEGRLGGARADCVVTHTVGVISLADSGATHVGIGALTVTSTGNYGSIIVSGLAHLQFQPVGPALGSADTSRIWLHDAQASAWILGSSYTVAGNSTYLWASTDGGWMFHEANTVTCIGSPAFSVLALGIYGGMQFGSDTFTSCGGVTGQRFNLQNGSYLTTGVYNTTYLPGSALGVADFTSSVSGAPVGNKVQKFTANGTWTPSPGTLSATISCWGAGAGAGGAQATTVGNTSAGSGGGAGSKSIAYVTAAQLAAAIATPPAVTIGVAGAGGAAGLNNGVSGTNSGVGTLCVGRGGSNGAGGPLATEVAGGFGGTPGTGDVTGNGAPGFPNMFAGQSIAFAPVGGIGGSAEFGAGGLAGPCGSSCNGAAALGFASGGGGGASTNGSAAAAGGAGAPGLVVIQEFTNQ